MSTKIKEELKVLGGLLILSTSVSLAFAIGMYSPEVEPNCSAWTQHDYDTGNVPVACFEKYEKKGTL